MARARIIKPGFFTNEELGSCPMQTRLLYIGLWTLADRAGILEYRPLRIKAQIFPFDSVNVEKSLSQLAERGLILIYQVDTEKYISIPSWQKHQKPHAKEQPSSLPAPTLVVVDHNLGSGQPQPRSLPARPLTLNPIPGNPLSCNPPPKTATAVETDPPDLSDLAHSIHARHPRHRRPTLQATERALAQICMDTPDPLARAQGIDDGHAGWVASNEWTREGGRYVPHLLKYLDPVNGLWMTDPPEAKEERTVFDELLAEIDERERGIQ